MTQLWLEPTPEAPYWRDAQGHRLAIDEALAASKPQERAQLLRRHAEAVCRMINASAEERAAGEAARARALATHASRLCGELAGLWPAGSDRPL